MSISRGQASRVGGFAFFFGVRICSAENGMLSVCQNACSNMPSACKARPGNVGPKSLACSSQMQKYHGRPAEVTSMLVTPRFVDAKMTQSFLLRRKRFPINRILVDVLLSALFPCDRQRPLTARSSKRGSRLHHRRRFLCIFFLCFFV